MQILNVLQHKDDDPKGIPRRELSKLIYGKDSVFARSPTPDQVKGISRSDLEAFIRKWERPNGAIMGVLGEPCLDIQDPLLIFRDAI